MRVECLKNHTVFVIHFSLSCFMGNVARNVVRSIVKAETTVIRFLPYCIRYSLVIWLGCRGIPGAVCRN